MCGELPLIPRLRNHVTVLLIVYVFLFIHLLLRISQFNITLILNRGWDILKKVRLSHYIVRTTARNLSLHSLNQNVLIIIITLINRHIMHLLVIYWMKSYLFINLKDMSSIVFLIEMKKVCAYKTVTKHFVYYLAYIQTRGIPISTFNSLLCEITSSVL